MLVSRLKRQSNKAARASVVEPSSSTGALKQAGSSLGEFDVAGLVKELLKLFREQGVLTISDINGLMPSSASPQLIEEVYTGLKAFDVEISDDNEVEKPQAVEV